MRRPYDGYLFLGLFCLLSAIRDVASEKLLTDASITVPQVVFFYSLSAVLIFPAVLIWTGRLRAEWKVFRQAPEALRDLGWLNLGTMLAFGAYFLAIDTPLGAARNALVDYAMTPFVTALFGVWLLGKGKVHRYFWVSAVLGIAGVILALKPIGSWQFDSADNGDTNYHFWLGVVLAVTGAAISGIFAPYLKKLMIAGLDKGFLIASRLVMTVFVFGAIVLVNALMGDGPTVREAAMLLAIGAAGFSLPLFLILYSIERFEIEHFAAAMFLIPIMIYLFSFAMKQVTLDWINLVGILLVFSGVIFYDWKSKRSQ